VVLITTWTESERRRMPISQDPTATTNRRSFAERLDRMSIRRLQPADLFDAWMFAEADATRAIAAWEAAPAEEKGDAYAAYVAALDRETAATHLLARRLSFG
jgi:hypothetical protein